MRIARSCRLPLLLLIVGAGWATPSKEDSPSVVALKDNGLTKAGTTFTIEEEKPVLAKMKEARTAYAAYAAMSDEHAMHQQLAERATQLEQQRSDLQLQIDELNLRIGDGGATPSGNTGPMGGGGGMGGQNGFPGRTVTSPLTLQRNQLKASLIEVANEQKTLRNQSPQAKDTTALDARVKKADEVFKAILADLRKQVDEVKKKYGSLEADSTVAAALADLKKGNSRLHLGPSDAFIAGTKELEKAEGRFLGKRAATVSKKKTKSKK